MLSVQFSIAKPTPFLYLSATTSQWAKEATVSSRLHTGPRGLACPAADDVTRCGMGLGVS